MASAVDRHSKIPPRPSVGGPRTDVVEPFVMPFQPGEVIVGKYKVVRLIGTGGVGFVVSARHVGFDEVVALKFLRPEFATHSEAVTRFTIEARASFKIRSEHVARVLDVDTLPDGTPFIAMELLEGTDLRSLLDRCRMLSIEPAVDYVLQTCEALAAAHALHVIHRDIKPENLFLTGEIDHIKVLDFGISKVALTSDIRQTSQALTRIAIGTPPYMSPEQVRASSDLDARSDIWSVGCVLYELLTGTAPFDRLSLMQSCAAVLEEEPVPMRDLRPAISQDLSDVVMRCLQKDPAARYQDVAELADALAPFGSGQRSGYPERCRSFLNGDGMGRRSTPSALPPVPRRSSVPSMPQSLIESSVHRRRTGLTGPLATGMPARYPTSSRASAPFPTGTVPRAPSAMPRHSTGMRYPTGHNRLPTGVGSNGPLARERERELMAAQNKELLAVGESNAVTRPTIRFDAATEAELLELSVPHSAARWPWALGVGAILAFGSAYLLTQRDEPSPRTAHLATAAPTAPVAPPVATIPEPTASAPVVEPTAIESAIVQPPAEEAPPVATAPVTSAPLASAPTASATVDAAAPKAKSRPAPRPNVPHKAASSNQAMDEIDVGF